MRRIAKILMIFALILITDGCKKDEGLTHVTDFEMKIYRAVNTYRRSKSLPDINLQLLMVDDAQNYSKEIASGDVPYGVDGIMGSLNTLKTNLGGDAIGAVVEFSSVDHADSIVNRMIRDPLKRDILEQDFNQTGVGSAKNSNGTWYVTQLFIHIP